MERWSGRVAIVTGASSGIGAALARKLVKCGMRVVGCARNIGPIQILADELKDEKGCLFPVKCDISIEDDVTALVARIREEYGGVDVCINNAGVVLDAPFLTGKTNVWKLMTDVNIVGTATVTREVVADMRDRGVNDGHIINMNSIAGHTVQGASGPMINFYRSTQYAMTAMTECIRGELRLMKSNIRISQVSPGIVNTGIYQKVTGASDAQTEEYYKNRAHLDVDDVVDAVIYQLSAPAHVQVHDVILRHNEEA